MSWPGLIPARRATSSASSTPASPSTTCSKASRRTSQSQCRRRRVCDEDRPTGPTEPGMGAATHSIVVGNTVLGNLDRGITFAKSELERLSDRRAPRRTKSHGTGTSMPASVLLLEVQSDGAVTHMEDAAEAAFDAGAVVVAVIGNAHDDEPCAVETDLWAGAEHHHGRSVRRVRGDRTVRPTTVAIWPARAVKPDVSFPSFAKGASKECSDCLDETAFIDERRRTVRRRHGAADPRSSATFSPANTPARGLGRHRPRSHGRIRTIDDAVNDDMLNLEGAGRHLSPPPGVQPVEIGRSSWPVGRPARSRSSRASSAGGAYGDPWPQPAGRTASGHRLRLAHENDSWRPFILHRFPEHPAESTQLNSWSIEIESEWQQPRSLLHLPAQLSGLRLHDRSGEQGSRQ